MNPYGFCGVSGSLKGGREVELLKGVEGCLEIPLGLERHYNRTFTIVMRVVSVS